MNQTSERTRFGGLTLPPSAGATGLLIAVFVGAAIPSQFPSLTNYALFALGLLAGLAIWLFFAPLLVSLYEWPGRQRLFARYSFSMPDGLRKLLLVLTASFALAAGWHWYTKGLRGAEYVAPADIVPGLGFASLWFACVLFIQRHLGHANFVRTYLFGGRNSGYWLRYVQALLVPAAGVLIGSGIGLLALGLFAPWKDLDAALHLLDRLAQSGASPASTDALLKATRSLQADQRQQVAEATLALLGVQLPAKRGPLALGLLGKEDLFERMSRDEGFASTETARSVREEALTILRRRAWWAAPMSAGSPAARLGALPPVSDDEAALRFQQIGQAAKDPVLTAWVSASGYCKGSDRQSEPTWLHQERVWLRHVLCTPDRETARRLHRMWLEAHLAAAPTFPVPPALTPASHATKSQCPDALPPFGWARLSDWTFLKLCGRHHEFETHENFERSNYRDAWREPDPLDQVLFGDKIGAGSARSCMFGETGWVAHLWEPGGDNTATWFAALVRLQRTVKSKSPAAAGPAVPFIALYRRKPSPGCTRPWEDETKDGSLPKILGRRSGERCLLPANLGVCGFPAFVPLRNAAPTPNEGM